MPPSHDQRTPGVSKICFCLFVFFILFVCFFFFSFVYSFVGANQASRPDFTHSLSTKKNKRPTCLCCLFVFRLFVFLLFVCFSFVCFSFVCLLFVFRLLLFVFRLFV